MKKRMRLNALLAMFILSITVMVLHSSMVNAAESKKNLSSTNYQVGSGSSFSFGANDTLTTFAYGQTSLGSLYIKGELNTESEYGGVKAYGTNGNITFGYDYYNTFQGTSKDNWNLYDSDWFEDKITIENEQIKTSKNIDNGAIIIQKSKNKIDWENVASVSNFFNQKIDRNSVYTTTEEELKEGTYYRVIVVYTMQKRTKTGWNGIGDSYDKKTFAEVYEVFLCSDNNYVSVHDLSTRRQVSLPISVKNGFFIQKNDSSATVKVQNSAGVTKYAVENATYTEPGEYTITVITKLNKLFTYKITVDGGVYTKELEATTYDCGDNKGYKAENKLEGSAECCLGSHLKLFIGQSSEREIVKSKYYNVTSYGVQGNYVEFYVSLNDLSTGWSLSSDSWGKKEKETVDGVITGEIGTGALIVQKSSDGKSWENVESGKYANGLYTTDFEKYYGQNGKVLIYTPDGEDIINGSYYRILYAYEVKKDKTTKNYLEEYVFYLCNASTDAVTFHNLTVKEQLNEALSDVDDCTADLYKGIESLKSGSYTTTGFSIDKSKNKTASVSVKKNGVWIGNELTDISETGRYDITIIPKAGAYSVVTIYVDTEDPEAIYNRYFGDSFITGKRIYTEDDYPTFEGGLAQYNINAVSSYYCPLYGTITNKTTGTVINIEATYDAKAEIISEPGEYEAVFSTNSFFTSSEKSGDNRVFTFRFKIIANGTAPGPQINEKELQKYAGLSMSDSLPFYYGLTYQSAGKGYITLAFATYKEAYDYAYNYEKGMVEKQADGSYRYTGAFQFQKKRYESDCDLTDAVYYFAEQAVQFSYFDLTDSFTYYTLEESVLEANKKNYRKLELNRSVIIFADGQQAKLTQGNGLPIISDKPYAYIVPGDSDIVKEGENVFKFVKDKYECDSQTVTIIDCNGAEYNIEYQKSVGSQLEKQGCPSGVVTIVEKNMYGDINTYEALFIRENDNSSEIGITYSLGDSDYTVTFTQESEERELVVDEFSISYFTDNLDQWAYVIVSDGKTKSQFINGNVTGATWTLPGEYEVKCVNRLGYSFKIKIIVNESDKTVISFSGLGSDGLQSISTELWAKNIQLPIPSRYGYEFVGYTDENGNFYSDEIISILEKGSIVLTTQWKPKQYTLTIIDSDTKCYDIEFGREIAIPTPVVENGYQFVSWTLNGNDYEENVFVLETESDVTLIAKMEKISNTKGENQTENKDKVEDEGEQKPTRDESNKSNAAIVILVITLVIAGFIILGIKKRIITNLLRRINK